MIAPARQTDNAFELKGEMSMLSVFRLLNMDIERVSQQLAHKVNQAPEFFSNMPVIIDLQDLAGMHDIASFTMLIELLRNYGFVPVGVRNGSVSQHRAAKLAGLALLKKRRIPRDDHSPSSSAPSNDHQVASEYEQNPPSVSEKSRLIVRPVRSGQQVYVAKGDLVVVAPVSAGSELLADGCIHVYGPLRGRALAGINGDYTARIFCQSLEAELIAIAGHYQINEELATDLKGKPTQIWLESQRLMISPI
jgi:septum site-determining protein MinC